MGKKRGQTSINSTGYPSSIDTVTFGRLRISIKDTSIDKQIGLRSDDGSVCFWLLYPHGSFSGRQLDDEVQPAVLL